MATIYDAINGEIKTSDQFTATDPFWQAGTQLRQAQLQPRTNSEAIWGPMVQALIGGTLQGIGKKQARETEYDAYKSYLKDAYTAKIDSPTGDGAFGPVADAGTYANNILNSTYLNQDAPKGWTGAQGKGDLIKAALIREELDKELQRKDEIAQKLDFLKQSGPIEAANAELVDAAKYRAKEAAEGSQAQLGPALDAINALPDKMQGPALKELEEIKKFNESIPEIKTMMQEAHQASQKLKGIKLPWPLNESVTNEQATRDTISANIFGAISGIVPGVLTDQDAKRTVDSFIPTYWDSKEAAEKKTQGLIKFIQSKVSSAPILEGAGIIKRDSPSAGPTTSGAIPPGMKRLRNPKTGEVKDVPING